MKIEDLFEGIKILNIKSSNPALEIKHISCDSKSIKKDTLFVAIKGTRVDGHKFIFEAIKRGAKAVVVEDKKYLNLIKRDIAIICVKDSRNALAHIAANFYNHPSQKIKVIGVTGTNGKTTITYLLESILKEAGFKVGVIGTINYRLDGRVYNSINTTPDALTIHGYLKKMSEEGIDYAIMEVSSHALDQDRVAATKFFCAIFTNLTQDHLDYHKSKKEYFNAKAKLFKSLAEESFAIINNDDIYGRRMINLTCANVIRYGRKDCDVKLKDINFKGGVSKFSVKLGDRDILIKSHLVGMHNAYNILAAVACAFNLGINTRKIQQGIWKLKCVPGRLEPVNVGQSYKIFVDYAHTDDGLKNVLTALNGLYDKNKIISVFGCGGDRDRGKRPKMGHVASSLSDYVIITSDNPRTESAEDIAHQIVSGIKRDNFEVTLERRAAIRKALLLADNNTVILIAGKGHEQYQILGNKRIHFDDRRVSEELIESLG